MEESVCTTSQKIPRKTWNEVIRRGLKRKVSKDQTNDTHAGKSLIRKHPTHANMENEH